MSNDEAKLAETLQDVLWNHDDLVAMRRIVNALVPEPIRTEIVDMYNLHINQLNRRRREYNEWKEKHDGDTMQ